ncbi:LuxR C-terminal-related transcriptional regulator [Saccharopolyspora sp. K220]|uniref:LuxR C-terminal-related transcriptional regulator n=1 Tax=Saccharopolyspora soli TaxID=2926618 RepID=UPI001F59E791|nr:LuxR C-terminal-related transcriptional regulator [Saccharopolyspora soli]MCI2423245.1 LuxR C-terminal-related transcriptional regulator [Saccharopolyspora soli]
MCTGEQDRTGAPALRLVTPNRFGGGTSALVAAARSEVLVMSSHTTATNSPIGAIRPIDRDNVRRGVQYRVIVPDPARTAPGLAIRLAELTLAGAATRTVPVVPVDALVIDRSLVLLASGSGATALRLPSVITTTVELFERVWCAAVPLTTVDQPDTAPLHARERALLALLSAGLTDTAAAARLNISVRTVRRVVADVMSQLGARSRFQAGVKAAERGWLMDAGGPQSAERAG